MDRAKAWFTTNPVAKAHDTGKTLIPIEARFPACPQLRRSPLGGDAKGQNECAARLFLHGTDD